MRPVRGVARALLGSIFVIQGAQAVANPEKLAPTAKKVTDRIAPMIVKAVPGAPTEDRSLVQLNGAVQVVGGLLMLTRLSRPAALLLAGSLVPTTLAGHSFW